VASDRARRSLSAPEDPINVTIMHCVRAPARARGRRPRGRRAVGAQHGAHGVATEFPMTRGAVALDLAGVLSAAGRGDEPLLEARRALRGFEGKGDRRGTAAGAAGGARRASSCTRWTQALRRL
jgi:hypothetical protein